MPAIPALIAVGGTIIGGMIANKGAKDSAAAAAAQNQAQIDANAKLPQNDPRIAQYLYGNGTQQLKPGVTPTWGEANELGQQLSTNPQTDYIKDNGLLGQYMDALAKPQDAAMAGYGKTAGDYLAKNGAGDLNTIRNGALQQMGGIQAPGMQAAQMEAPLQNNVPMAQAAQIDTSMLKNMGRTGVSLRSTPAVSAATVNAPSQNNLDLTDAYKSMIYGEFGANPYLTGAIDKGIHQSQNAFGQMQRDATQNFNENLMPGVRGSALLSGQYGGTRQGIAEGRALSDYSKNEQRAISQMNQYNTDAAVAAQAQAFKEDADRAAMLMQSLGGEQYGVAKTNAANQQAANSQTSAQQQQTNMTEAQMQLQYTMDYYNKALAAATAQAGLSQQTNLANQNATLGVNQANQQTQFGANTNNMNAQNTASGANLQSQLTTNQLNSNNLQSGMSNLGGLLGNAYSTAGTQDQYDLNKMNNGMGVLAPYLAKNATPTQLQPVYNNSAAAGLGGALAGAQLGQAVYNGYQMGGSGVANPLKQGAANGYNTGAAAGGGGNFYDGYGWGT